MKNHLQPLAIPLLLLLTFGAWNAMAEQEDGKKQDQTGYGPRTEQERLEATQIEQEDQHQLAKDGEFQLTTLDGKIYLDQDLDPRSLPWVVGKFVSDRRVYGLILDNPDLLSRLTPINAKPARYQGRIRCSGKYFIVTSIYKSLGVSSSRPKRGGM